MYNSQGFALTAARKTGVRQQSSIAPLVSSRLGSIQQIIRNQNHRIDLTLSTVDDDFRHAKQRKAAGQQAAIVNKSFTWRSSLWL